MREPIGLLRRWAPAALLALLFGALLWRALTLYSGGRVFPSPSRGDTTIVRRAFPPDSVAPISFEVDSGR
jgi:hypothetical protein